MGRKGRPSQYSWTLWARALKPSVSTWCMMKIADLGGCERDEARLIRRHAADRDLETLILPPGEVPGVPSKDFEYDETRYP